MVMRVVLFDGQGCHPSSSSSTSAQQPRSPLAALFVRQTRAAFVNRVAALEASTYDAFNTHTTRALLSQIREGRITLPTSDVTLLRNPLIALPSLFITQVTRLLEEVETNGPLAKNTPIEVIGYSSGILPALLVATSFPSPFAEDANLSSSSQVRILKNALALFEVSISTGVEAQMVKEAMLYAGGIPLDDPVRDGEWSSVIFGEKRDALEARVASWNSRIGDPLLRVYLTAQTAATCHTLSGVPSVLRDFVDSGRLSSSVPFHSLNHSPSNTSPSSLSSLSSDASSASGFSRLTRKSSASSIATPILSPCPSPNPTSSGLKTSLYSLLPCTDGATSSTITISGSGNSSMTKPLAVYTLFHASTSLSRAARERLLSGLFSSTDDCYLEETRLTLSALKLVGDYTLYDTRTGSTVPSTLSGKTLIELVVDSILLDRIEFVHTIETLANKVEGESEVEIMNFGPSTGLARAAVRSVKELIANPVKLIDASSSRVVKANGTPADVNGQEPIAIVGMAVNLPGARDATELWDILEQGLNTVEEIPESRFSISPYAGVHATNPGRKLKTRFGNFLPDGLHAKFDNAFFRISPREARAIDPQARVLMRVGLQALEASGLVVEDSSVEEENISEGVVRSEDVGCFVGVATNDYVQNVRNEIGVHYATGTLPAFLAGRLAYALHLSGPSMVLDTACSSSLVAIHQACRALLAGDCKAALAGGVNVISSPDMYLGLDRAHFLSPSGNCKPWDASADGYCRAEGSGMFVLKKLSDALASSDNILGVIRGTEVNQSAAAVSITRPHGRTQMNLFRTLLEKADVKPEEVSIVEAHGTGTQAGDPEELNSLRQVLSPDSGSGRSVSNMLNVTSIKGNIGHSEAASGAASLAKVLLMLRHRLIPSQVGLVNLNPKIEPLENDFTRINTSGACIEWTPNSAGRRIALVNNFGAAGSNAAMLVEETPSRGPAPSIPGPLVVGLSAETEDAVLRLRDSYIASVNDSTLVDFGYTATARRKLRPWRIAVTADSAANIAQALSQARPIHIKESSQANKKIVFLFSGQGGQYIGMGRQLYATSEFFRSVVDDCHQKLVSWGYPGVLSIITLDGCSNLGRDEEIVAFQCAMFVLEYGLFSLWKRWGVKPDAIAGHSLGEYAALVAAEVLSVDSGLRLVARRARLMAQRCQQNASSMLLVRLPAQVVTELLSQVKGCETLSIACLNGPTDVVIGGPKEQLALFKKHAEQSGAKCASINVPFAYHTASMDPVLEDLSSFARKFDFAPPMIPIASNVTGTVVHTLNSTVFNSEYLSKHCRQAVRFEEGVRNLVGELGGVTTFVEIGPHPICLPMVSQLASETGATSLHSLNKRMSPHATLCSVLSCMYTLRDGISWGKVYRDLYPSARCIEVPGYPLVGTQFWVPFEEAAVAPPSSEPVDPLKRFSFLACWTQKPSSRDGNVSEFETPIEHLVEYITGHNVASSPLCPASVYHELALSATKCTLEHMDESFADILTLSDLQFTLPLVYDPLKRVVVRTSVNLHPKGSKHAGTFTVSSVVDGKEQSVHCTGFFQRRKKDVMDSKLQLHLAAVKRGKAALLNYDNGVYRETLRTRTIYELIFSRVVQYSKLYQVIDTMTLDERNGEGFATFRLSPEQASKGFVAQPVFIDALLHAAGFLINSRASGNDAFICNQVDASKVLSNLDPSATFEVYCTTTPEGECLVLADAWAVQSGDSGKVVAHIKRMRFSRVRLSSLSRHLSRLEDVPSRNSTPAPFVRSAFERSASPMTPARLGSPFRPLFQTVTPSSVSVSTADNSSFNSSSEVIRLLAVLCGVSVSEVKLSSNVADLGIDSLIWIELVGQLKTIVPDLLVDVTDLMLSTTVGDIIGKIKSIQHGSDCDEDSPRTQTPLSKPAQSFKPRHDISLVQSQQECPSASAYLVKEILGRVLDIPSVDLSTDDSLDAVGLDSLGSIEAIAQLQEQFSASLTHDFFIEYPTVGSVQAAIAKITSQNSHSRQSSSSTLVESEPLQKVVGPERTLLPLQTRNDNASPLFLVHDGSGLGHCYSRIGELDRHLYGISNPKLLSGENWEGGIPEMAAHYIGRMMPIVTAKGCVLGGWSFGGVVAFHMACELMKSGVKVAGVVLIDSPSPFTQKPLPDALIDSVVTSNSESESKQQARLVQLARRQMCHATQALVAYEPTVVLASTPEYPNVVMLRCADAFSLKDIRRKVSLEPIPFLEERNNPRTSISDWERLVGREIPVLDVPGHHFEPFSTKIVPVLTQQLKRAMALFDAAI